MEYAENGTDPVATYTALDPEGRPIYWSLLSSPLPDPLPEVGGTLLLSADVADAEDFTISSDGVLSFKLPPDFEKPESATATEVENLALAVKNVYKIVVVASDDAPGAAVDDADADIRMKAYHKVTVTVTDVDEDGSISLSAQQPQVGVPLIATLTDQDATDTVGDVEATPATLGLQPQNAKWKWEQAPAADGPWTVIVGATANTETPVAGIVDKYLRATVTYTDAYGDDKSAMNVSAHAIRAVPSGTNSTPVFPAGADARTVKENSPPGTNVGKPVAAGDAGDILTYALAPSTDQNDNSNYRIDAGTGQITVGSRTTLDSEADTGDRNPGAVGFLHTVTVTATDPWGMPAGDAQSAASQSVAITIGNVNEAPSITAGVTKIEQPENQEESTSISIYVATDVDVDDGDTQAAAWSLTGPDAGGLTISTTGSLTFKTNPNFESPVDADMDNVYMVTVVATDAGTSTERLIGVDKLTATRDVVITVTNADDDGNYNPIVRPAQGRD